MTLPGGPVRAALFDYGLTLVDFARPVEAIANAQVAVAALIEAAGHRPPAAGELRLAVHDRVEAEVAAHEGAGGLEEIDVAALERRAFADLGLQLDEQLLDACSRLVQEAWFAGVRPYPETAAVLAALRRGGLRLGVCSNAPYRPTSMHEQLRHVGIAALLDAAVFSSEVGWRKPSPRIFTAALDAVGAGAGETVFIGDRLREDVAGAHAAGMRTVLVARGAGVSQPRVGDGRPDALITSLAELPALLLGDHPVVAIPGTEN